MRYFNAGLSSFQKPYEDIKKNNKCYCGSTGHINSKRLIDVEVP